MSLQTRGLKTSVLEEMEKAVAIMGTLMEATLIEALRRLLRARARDLLACVALLAMSMPEERRERNSQTWSASRVLRGGPLSLGSWVQESPKR